MATLFYLAARSSISYTQESRVEIANEDEKSSDELGNQKQIGAQKPGATAGTEAQRSSMKVFNRK